MVKQICFLEQLPDDFGKRGRAFTPYHDRAHNAGQTIMQYASLGGLCLSIISLAMVMI